MKYPIDRKERITLGGMTQTIHIWGTKQENPVILFLHGVPVCLTGTAWQGTIWT